MGQLPEVIISFQVASRWTWVGLAAGPRERTWLGKWLAGLALARHTCYLEEAFDRTSCSEVLSQAGSPKQASMLLFKLPWLPLG